MSSGKIYFDRMSWRQKHFVVKLFFVAMASRFVVIPFLSLKEMLETFKLRETAFGTLNRNFVKV